MRYDTPIYFQVIPESEYNSVTGNYDEPQPIETMRWASVNGTDVKTMKLIFGDIKQGSLIVHIQNHYGDPFDFIRIGNKRYQVEARKNHRVKDGFVLSEVQ